MIIMIQTCFALLRTHIQPSHVQILVCLVFLHCSYKFWSIPSIKHLSEMTAFFQNACVHKMLGKFLVTREYPQILNAFQRRNGVTYCTVNTIKLKMETKFLDISPWGHCHYYMWYADSHTSVLVYLHQFPDSAPLKYIGSIALWLRIIWDTAAPKLFQR